MNKIFYFHIPKTAGSTLINILDKYFENTIHHIESIKSINKDYLNKFDAISGHMTYTMMTEVLDLKEWITLATFREPYSHIVSHLCWIRKLADDGEEQRFIKHEKHFQDLAMAMKRLDFSSIKDVQKLVQYLEKNDFSYLFNTQTLYMDTLKDIDSAIANMKKINIVGLTESLDFFIEKIHLKLNISSDTKPTKILNKNTNKYGFDLSDTETKESLLPLIKKDLLLYNEVKKRLSEE